MRDPDYCSNRQKALDELRDELDKGAVDEPTIDVLKKISHLTSCYTLQSCFGHFVSGPFTKDRNTKRVSEIEDQSPKLHYRIAYVAFCVENSAGGRALLEELKTVASLDPDYLQYGSADWFWERCVNSYVLQVSPLRNACQDHFDVNRQEASRIEQARDIFFDKLQEIVSRNLGRG